MKLRYYLRGLGIGVVVTAIIMTVALGNKRPMTDEEVIKRAKELGMIENSVLADRTDEAVESIGDEVVDHEADDNEVVDQEVADNDTDVEETNQNETTEEESSKEEPPKEEPPKEETNKDVVSITVVGGDTSWSVSKRMEEAGLIDSAKDFDAHLCRYGYDKKISVGTYDIPKTATHEDMAKIITKTD